MSDQIYNVSQNKDITEEDNKIFCALCSELLEEKIKRRKENKNEVFSKGTAIQKSTYEKMTEEEKEKVIKDLEGNMILNLPQNDYDYKFSSNTWLADGEYRIVGILRRVK
jgi:hypothetical protein